MTDYPYIPPPHPKYRLDRSAAEMNYQQMEQSLGMDQRNHHSMGDLRQENSDQLMEDSEAVETSSSGSGLAFRYSQSRLQIPQTINLSDSSQFPQNLVNDQRTTDAMLEHALNLNSSQTLESQPKLLPGGRVGVSGVGGVGGRGGEPPKRKPCPECGKLLANVNEHVKSVHWQVKNYSCELCDYSSSFKHDLVKHTLSRNHQFKKIFSEIKHSEKEKEKAAIKEVKVKHLKVKMETPRQQVMSHTLSMAGSGRGKHCRECGKMVVNMNEHIRYVHLKEKNFGCVQCEYKTLFKSDLTKHENAVHHGIRKICIRCGKHVANLSEHVRFVHEQSKDYKCDHCAYACVKPADLRKHIIAVHKFGKVKAESGI